MELRGLRPVGLIRRPDIRESVDRQRQGPFHFRREILLFGFGRDRQRVCQRFDLVGQAVQQYLDLSAPCGPLLQGLHVFPEKLFQGIFFRLFLFGRGLILAGRVILLFLLRCGGSFILVFLCGSGFLVRSVRARHGAAQSGEVLGNIQQLRFIQNRRIRGILAEREREEFGTVRFKLLVELFLRIPEQQGQAGLHPVAPPRDIAFCAFAKDQQVVGPQLFRGQALQYPECRVRFLRQRGPGIADVGATLGEIRRQDLDPGVQECDHLFLLCGHGFRKDLIRDLLDVVTALDVRRKKQGVRLVGFPGPAFLAELRP